jgi:hypothetical protein
MCLAPAPIAKWQGSSGLRDTSVRLEGFTDFAIPKHLLHQTGVYMGAWGSVTSEGKLCAHLKLGKAVEQSVYGRVKDHYSERPHTFVLLYMAGCDGSVCHFLEAAMKHVALAVLKLQPLGNSREEFIVDVDFLQEVVAQVVAQLEQRHADILTRAEDVPAPDRALHTVEFFAKLIARADDAARARALTEAMSQALDKL